MRAQGELEFGFDVHEGEKNEFVVSAVRERGVAARAGLSIGDRVMKFKRLPLGDREGEGLRRWCTRHGGSNSLNEINANPPTQAIRAVVRSATKQPGNFSAKPVKEQRAVGCHVLCSDA